MSLKFRAIASNGDSGKVKLLTRANCTVTMQYVEVQVECNGGSCHSTAIRPSTQPATHPEALYAETRNCQNFTRFTPLNGLGNWTTDWAIFFDQFVNATNPKAGCSGPRCAPSPIESHLGVPDKLQDTQLPPFGK